MKAIFHVLSLETCPKRARLVLDSDSNDFGSSVEVICVRHSEGRASRGEGPWSGDLVVSLEYSGSVILLVEDFLAFF